jgi:hypothetical protein
MEERVTPMSSSMQQDAAQGRPSRAIQRLEIGAAILPALATVATAWSSYQAARWNAESAVTAARANALKIESAKAESRGNTFGSIDVTAFTGWVDAYATDNAELTEFYENRFRDEFQPAFEAWLATDPFNDASAPSTPFQMPEYVRADIVEAEELKAQSDAFVEDALENAKRATNYILCVVLFAAALFFAGLTTRFSSPGPRRAVLACGLLVFIGALVWMVTFPVSVDI